MQVALISPQDSLETNRAGPLFFLFIYFFKEFLFSLTQSAICVQYSHDFIAKEENHIPPQSHFLDTA